MDLRRLSVAAAASLLALSACSSEPGPKAVLRDVIETLDVSDAAKQCMTAYVDGLSEDHLKSLGEDDANQDFRNGPAPDLSRVSPAFREFYQQLQDCVNDPAAATTSTGTGPVDSTGAADTSAPATTNG